MGVFRMRSHAPTASRKNVRFSSMRVACAAPHRIHDAQDNADDNRCQRTSAVLVMAQLWSVTGTDKHAREGCAVVGCDCQ